MPRSSALWSLVLAVVKLLGDTRVFLQLSPQSVGSSVRPSLYSLGYTGIEGDLYDGLCVGGSAHLKTTGG